MPSPTGEATAISEPAGPMMGVNLREDRILIGQTDLAKAVNADMNLSPGAIVIRLGSVQLSNGRINSGSTPLPIRRQALINGYRYQVEGTNLYRDFVSIGSGILSLNYSTAFQGYQPLVDTTLWAFIADDQVMQKDNGTSLVPWTMAQPAAAATVGVGAAGTLTGTYKVAYTYVRKVGGNLQSPGAVVAESNPSLASGSAVLANQQLSVTGILASTDAQVTHVRLYRTVANGSLFLFDQDLNNGSTSATSTQADIALGGALSLTDNSPPPRCSQVALWNETFWLTHDLLNPTYLYYGKRFNPESFPPANFLSIGDASDPLQTSVPFGGLLGVFSRKTKYRIVGNAVTGYAPEESMSRRGTSAYQAVVTTEFGVIFVARDGIWRTDFSSPDVNMSQAIFPLFVGETVNGLDPINWNAVGAMRAAFFKNRYFLTYPSGTNTTCDMVMVYSMDVEEWYFYAYSHAGGIGDLYYEELNNQLLGGDNSSTVFILEDGSQDDATDIALDCETKDFAGASKDVRKLFQFIRIDANTGGDTLTCALYVDDVLKTTQTFSSITRTEKLLTVAGGTVGYHWRIKFTYTGHQRIRIYPPAAVYMPLVSH